MPPPGVFPYSKGAGPVTDDTMRVALAGGATSPDNPMGSKDDAPATTPTSTTEATMIALLKTIANKNITIDTINGDIELNTDALEGLLDGLSTGQIHSKIVAADNFVATYVYVPGSEGTADERFDYVTYNGTIDIVTLAGGAVVATPKQTRDDYVYGGASPYYITSKTRSVTL